jgi:tetratricopeptide (TPR) repeat protein
MILKKAQPEIHPFRQELFRQYCYVYWQFVTDATVYDQSIYAFGSLPADAKSISFEVYSEALRIRERNVGLDHVIVFPSGFVMHDMTGVLDEAWEVAETSARALGLTPRVVSTTESGPLREAKMATEQLDMFSLIRAANLYAKHLEAHGPDPRVLRELAVVYAVLGWQLSRIPSPLAKLIAARSITCASLADRLGNNHDEPTLAFALAVAGREADADKILQRPHRTFEKHEQTLADIALGLIQLSSSKLDGKTDQLSRWARALVFSRSDRVADALRDYTSLFESNQRDVIALQHVIILGTVGPNHYYTDLYPKLVNALFAEALVNGEPGDEQSDELPRSTREWILNDLLFDALYQRMGFLAESFNSADDAVAFAKEVEGFCRLHRFGAMVQALANPHAEWNRLVWQLKDNVDSLDIIKVLYERARKGSPPSHEEFAEAMLGHVDDMSTDLKNFAYFFMGRGEYLDRGNAFLERGIVVSPFQPWFYFYLQRFKPSSGGRERALQVLPPSYLLYFKAAMSYLYDLAPNFDRALEMYLKAIDLNPQDPEAYLLSFV